MSRYPITSTRSAPYTAYTYVNGLSLVHPTVSINPILAVPAVQSTTNVSTTFNDDDNDDDAIDTTAYGDGVSAAIVGAASDAADSAAADDADSVACPPLFPPKHGYLECSRPMPERRHQQRRRRRRQRGNDDGAATDTNADDANDDDDADDVDADENADGIGGGASAAGKPNRPGSQCVLRCPTGFREAGRFEKICDFNGRWIGEEGGSCISECILCFVGVLMFRLWRVGGGHSIGCSGRELPNLVAGGVDRFLLVIQHDVCMCHEWDNYSTQTVMESLLIIFISL